MKIKLWLSLALIFVLAVAGLTGCSGGGPAQIASPVNINTQQGIWVTGEGKVTVTPDIANLSLGVSIQAAKVADAQSQAAATTAPATTEGR